MNRNEYKDFKNILNKYDIKNYSHDAMDEVIKKSELKLYSNYSEKDISIWHLIFSQLKYVSLYFWFAQIIAVSLVGLFTMQMTNYSYRNLIYIIFTAVSIISVYGVPEIIKSSIFKMNEIEASCKRGFSFILQIRILIIGISDLISIFGISLYLSNYFKQSFLLLAANGLLPFNIINSLSLLITNKFKTSYGSYISIALGIFLLALYNTWDFHDIELNGISYPLCILTSILLFVQLYILFKNSNEMGAHTIWN
ncbi:MAG: hypothetical protein Q8865_01115 [Bacillota bacterium]|nr:hypothetical protein [Bacillota bacterium]